MVAVGAQASFPDPLAAYSFNAFSLESNAGGDAATAYNLTWGTGMDGSDCLLFEDAGYAEFPSSVTVSGSASRTYCLWARIQASAFDGGALFFSGDIDESFTGECTEFTLRTKDFAPEFWAVTLSTFGTCDDTVYAESSSDGEWHHYCLAYDGTDWTFFLDASAQRSETVALDTGTMFPLRLGNKPTLDFGNQYGLTGDIDEVYIFDVSLSESEIESLYLLYTPMPTALPTAVPTTQPTAAPSSAPSPLPTATPTACVPHS